MVAIDNPGIWSDRLATSMRGHRSADSQRPSRARLVAGAAAVIVSLALGACGGSSGSGNGVATMGANQIVDSAVAAIVNAHTVHVSGSVDASGVPIGLDLSIVQGQGARGVVSESGLRFRLIDVGGFIYINGSQAFWQRSAGSAAARLFAGNWLKASSTTGSFASLSSLADIGSLVGALVHHGKLSKGARTTRDGRPVIEVDDDSDHGSVYVATTGRPYPVEIERSGSGAGHITFDRIDQPVRLVPPAASIDTTKLK